MLVAADGLHLEERVVRKNCGRVAVDPLDLPRRTLRISDRGAK
jgi:hypothetical protein